MGGVYLLCVILNTAINIVVLNKDLNCNQILYSYVNPLVIIGALSLVLFTGQFKMKPIKFINFISQSAFSIYLLHASNSIFNSIYKPIVLKIYDSQVGINVLLSIFGFITIVSLIAILLDQPRKWLFKVFDEKFLRRFGNKIIYPNFGY